MSRGSGFTILLLPNLHIYQSVLWLIQAIIFLCQNIIGKHNLTLRSTDNRYLHCPHRSKGTKSEMNDFELQGLKVKFCAVLTRLITEQEYITKKHSWWSVTFRLKSYWQSDYHVTSTRYRDLVCFDWINHLKIGLSVFWSSIKKCFRLRIEFYNFYTLFITTMLTRKCAYVNFENFQT